MGWGIVKKFPKFVLVFGVIVGSSGLFGLWWFKHRALQAFYSPRPVEDIRPKIEHIEAAPKELVLVDNDLYDLETGALIFRNWLKGGEPNALFYDYGNKKIIARYERGYVRYALDGKQEAALLQKAAPAFSDDLKWAVYAKDRDLWRADIDWTNFTFQNERRLTSIEQFNETYFAANIMLGTDRVIVVRNLNQLLRVDLERGDVKPTRIPLGVVAKQRSPNGRYLIGTEHGQLFCYDVETDESKAVAIGKSFFNDYQWLGNDRCVGLVATKSIVLYDRLKNTLVEIASLPSACSKMGDPSPDGHYIFGVGPRGNGVLIDVERKSAAPVTGGAGVVWVGNDTFAFSREVPDSDLRGTWLELAGGSERRVSPEPYLVGKRGALLMETPSGFILFATKRGLTKMKPDGDACEEIIKLQHPPARAIAFGEWSRK